MKRRDVNGRELARLAKVNREIISRLRRGYSQGTARDTARAIEQALRVPIGNIFAYADDPETTKAQLDEQLEADEPDIQAAAS